MFLKKCAIRLFVTKKYLIIASNFSLKVARFQKKRKENKEDLTHHDDVIYCQHLFPITNFKESLMLQSTPYTKNKCSLKGPSASNPRMAPVNLTISFL